MKMNKENQADYLKRWREAVANTPYMPSSGSEGLDFCAEWCDNCIHQHPDPEKSPQCDILLESLLGNQPPEWKYNSEGVPICTAFVKWDWGNDDGGWNEPLPPEPEDPGQLLLPFCITELFGFDDPEIIVTRTAILEI